MVTNASCSVPSSWFRGPARTGDDRSPRAIRSAAARRSLSWRDRRPPIHHDSRHEIDTAMKTTIRMRRHSGQSRASTALPGIPTVITHPPRPTVAAANRRSTPSMSAPADIRGAAPGESGGDTSIVVPMNRSASRLRASTRPRRSVSVITEPSGRGMPANRLWSPGRLISKSMTPATLRSPSTGKAITTVGLCVTAPMVRPLTRECPDDTTSSTCRSIAPGLLSRAGTPEHRNLPSGARNTTSRISG